MSLVRYPALAVLFSLLLLAAPARAAAAAPVTAPAGTRFRAVAELGSLAVLSHRVQFGKKGTYVNYVSEGGQENLYFNQRLSVEVSRRRHHVTLLYQPLSLETTAAPRRDLVVDEVTFPAGTPMRFEYGFPFYRTSYTYDVVDTPKQRLSLGGSLQIRNASIVFSSLDGTLYKANRNIGPVPLLKAVWERHPSKSWWFGTELDGIYAPVSYLNGDNNEVRGALIDWSWRAGMPINTFSDVFLNLRYLAGGATGTSDNSPKGSDGYVRNWLHFGVVSVGFILDPVR